MKLNKKSGFTLIEIIVVMIIVGILAAIALPNLFGNVTKSRGSSAIAAMDGIKTGIEQVAYQNNRVPTTADVTAAGLPAAAAGVKFGFTIAAAGGLPSTSNLVYTLTATDISGNTITLTRAATGVFTCNAGAGPYQGDC